MKNRVMSELKKMFRPEFLNRVDEVIVFKQLTPEQMRQIVDLMISRVRKQLLAQDILLEVSTKALDFLAEQGFDPSYGARPLRRAIQQHIEDPLAQEILARSFKQGDTILADVADGEIVFAKGSLMLPPAEPAGTS